MHVIVYFKVLFNDLNTVHYTFDFKPSPPIKKTSSLPNPTLQFIFVQQCIWVSFDINLSTLEYISIIASKEKKQTFLCKNEKILRKTKKKFILITILKLFSLALF